MVFIDNGLITKTVNKEARIFNAGETAVVSKLPFLYNWFWTATLGMPRKVDISELRQYAKSCWVQMVTNAIQKQLMTTDWDVIITDEENEEKFEEDINKVKKLLQYPNRNGMTFWEVWGPWSRDVLEIDAGVIFKGRNAAGELVELFPFDGSRFLFDLEQHGIVNGWYQYSYKYPKNKPLHFKKDEIIYGRVNLSNEQYPYGFSPLQSIMQEVELMIQSTRWNKEYYKNNAVPDGIVSVPMEKDQMDRFRTNWEQEMKGKAHKLLFHNSEGVDFKPMALSNKDMEWLEGQKWYFHLVFGAYGLSPQEVGFYENSNKSTGESQERITIKNAIKPYLQLISDKINREIVPDLVGHDDIKFEWFTKDDAAEKVEHEQVMAKLNANVITINEVRKMDGLDPVEWGDQPMSMVMQERAAEMFDEADDNSNDKKEEGIPKKEETPKSKEQEESNKSFTKELDPGEDMIEESDDYESFLKRKFGHWENEIFKFLDSTLKEELNKDYTKKTLGEFIQRLFNAVNTLDFRAQLKAVVRAHLLKGISDAESELKVDIGFTENFDAQVNLFTDRQLEGFTMEGGHWPGLKGVASDAQEDILNIVKEGIVDKKSLKEVKNEIKTKLSQYTGTPTTDGRATKIARTESTRFHNQAKLISYKESGLKGKKVWDAFLDERTSPICRELHDQKVELNELFKTSDGREWAAPPSHPNCRSVIRFELE
ncbi:MAG: putative portal protein [Prokaryotic dsDNA virus sp.]|jgi:HK97 family phage portal protein|nr:MAG: putative portal protein [Prokaryotic dsDNA virus sp.]|tara:strand:+ start:13750 stop:15879 length:2130 start_codon:yes stop_codon:yes gene_type:complete